MATTSIWRVKGWLLALVFYLHYEAPPDEQNFPMVMEMLRAAEVREDDDTYQSPLDELFERLEMRDPEHIAVKYYKDYHSGSAKTLKSIQITLAARLDCTCPPWVRKRWRCLRSFLITTPASISLFPSYTPSYSNNCSGWQITSTAVACPCRCIS